MEFNVRSVSLVVLSIIREARSEQNRRTLSGTIPELLPSKMDE